jgi:NAD(P)-dependent dehydrogenase (short-subunit alcohol dehydrogenase family)
MAKRRGVLVTGGSRGIGAATARRAAERGFAVAVNYREQRDAADEVVRAIESAGGSAVAVSGDVADEDDVRRMFDQSEQAFGTLVGLVNNAGVVGPQSQLADMELARIERVLAVNTLGTILCAREAVRRMVDGGAIVNVSSMAARLGSPNEYLDYAAAKGAVDAFTVGLAREVADRGIRVNAVRPGLIRTEIHAAGGEPGRVERLEAGVPMGRGGEPEEVAQAIVWLLGDEASYTTGAILDVSGGR